MERNEIIKSVPGVVNGYNELHDYLESLEGKKNYSEFPEMKSNPFVCLLSDELHVEWVKLGKNGNVSSAITDYVNTVTGEVSEIKSIEGGKIFYKKKIVDSSTYTKIYNKNIKEMFSLSSTALKLFGYFMSQIDFRDKEGMIYMSLEDAIAFCDYEDSSRSMIYKGLSELILKGFICKTVRPWTFYLNPKYVHNGDRIGIFEEYIKESEETIKDMLEDI